VKQAEKCKGIVLGFAIGLLSSGNVLAADEVPGTQDGNTDKPKAFDISIGTELMSGDTTYSIGFPVTFPDGSSVNGYFPFSQLEWPLDIWLARLDADLNIGASWRINGVLKTNISDPNDHMIDRDWLPPGGWLDVYSESNISEFDALIWDVDVEWAFLQRQSWNLYAGLGYQYQKFEYEGQLIQQYSPSGIPGFDLFGDGGVAITYEMTYKMPYALIGTDLQITPNFAIAGNFSYSPWVTAEDEDHHLLRDIVSKGDMDGDAVMIDVSGIYDFHSSWFFEGGLRYAKIDVDGDQTQRIDGITLGTVHQESESTQTSGYLNIGYRFK
jgi:outer membrane protease